MRAGIFPTDLWPMGGKPSGMAAPTVQASNITFSAVRNTTLTVGWTRGNGSRVIVLMKSGGAVDSNPVNGTGYTANAAFGSGTQIGTGNYVIYDGTGTSVNVTGLTSATAYHVAAYEYNGSGPTSLYQTASPATGNQTTLANLAAQFTAANSEYLSRATDALLSPTTAFTLAVWINQDSSATLGLANKYNAGAGWGSYDVSSKIRCYITTGNFADTTNTLTTGTYKLVVIVYDGSQADNATRLKIYLDGAEETLAFTGTIPASIDTGTAAFELGRFTTDYFNGRLGDAAFWKVALSGANVTSYHNSGKSLRFADWAGPAPNGWWEMDEASGTRADKSGNGFTLTDNNTVTSGTGNWV